jgi:hypothetical protein
MRIRVVIFAGLAAMIAATPAPAVAKNKCVYWFGFCTSCEKPYTCKNSHRTDTAKAPTKPNKKTSSKTTKAKPKRRAEIRIGRRRKPPTPTPATPARRQQATAPQTTNFDREFRRFKEFVRLKQRDGEFPANHKLADLYFRYKLWVLEREQSRSKPK